MQEILFGVIVSTWVGLAMIVFPLAGKRHGFSRVTILVFCLASIAPVVVIASFELEVAPIPAMCIAVVAFEIGLYIARKYLAGKPGLKAP